MAKQPMTAAHKQALAEGRAQARAVKNYLEALDARKPRRGRPRTPDSIRAQIAKAEKDTASDNVMTRLQAVQRVKDLEAELAALEAEETVDLAALEAEFVTHAKAYSDAKGIEKSTWRSMGVPADVLKKAGI